MGVYDEGNTFRHAVIRDLVLKVITHVPARSRLQVQHLIFDTEQAFGWRTECDMMTLPVDRVRGRVLVWRDPASRPELRNHHSTDACCLYPRCETEDQGPEFRERPPGRIGDAFVLIAHRLEVAECLETTKDITHLSMRRSGMCGTNTLLVP